MNFINFITIILLIMNTISLFAFEKDFFQKTNLKFTEKFTWNWEFLLNISYLNGNEDDNYQIINDSVIGLSFHFSKENYFLFRIKNYLYYPSIDEESSDISYFYDIEKLFFYHEMNDYNVIIGRNNYTMGSGVVFSNNSDGINFIYQSYGFKIEALISYTEFIKKEFDSFRINIDEIEKGSERLFFIGNIGYNFLNQFIYFIFLKQKDMKDYSDDAFSSKYDSDYFVLGFNGNFWKGFFLDTEFIYQKGKYFTSSDMDINAFAASFKLNYNTDYKSQLGFLIQYDIASGGYSTDQLIADGSSEDSNFSSFGQYDTGFVFDPGLSNIHIIKFKINANPFYFTNYFNNFYLAVEYNAYFKYFEETSINILDDSEQNGGESFIGQSLDLIFVWRVIGGMNIFNQVGVMFKGPVFVNKDPAIKVFSGIQLWF